MLMNAFQPLNRLEKLLIKVFFPVFNYSFWAVEGKAKYTHKFVFVLVQK